MFTGIITDVGTIVAIDAANHYRVQIQTQYETDIIPLGASIACNGVCLTVIDRGKNEFSAQVSEETRAKTTAKHWQTGMRINLERALALGDELGGHLVLGHVDGIANVKSITPIQDSTVWEISPPPELLPFIAPKGSVCLDGVALTTNSVAADSFSLTLVPHTLSCTNFQHLRPGSQINIEVDLIARYLARLISART